VSGLKYVGAAPTNPLDITTKLAVTTLIGATPPTQVSAASQVTSAAALKASKAYVDTQAAAYTSPAYVAAQDALNIPASSVGQPNGVAALDSGTHIPLTQVPSVGAGYLLGPFGVTAVNSGSTGSTPLKIADWDIGPQPLIFMPMVFCAILAQSLAQNSRPIIEVRMSNGAATYSAQTLVARGAGRDMFTDWQTVSVLSSPAVAGQAGPGAGYPPTYNTWLSAWLFDAAGNPVQIALDSSVVSGAVYLLKISD
jgi:hypothetical protein